MKCTSQLLAIDLELPYCVQVCAESFLFLNRLLRVVMPLACGDDQPSAMLSTADANATLLSLLRLIKANFARLTLAHVDPTDVGIFQLGDKPTLAPLHVALREVGVLQARVGGVVASARAVARVGHVAVCHV